MPRQKTKITKTALKKALREHFWNRTQAAKALGIHRATLRALMEEKGLEPPKKRQILEMTKEDWEHYLSSYGWNQTATAEALECHRSTVRKAIKDYGIQIPEIEEEEQEPIMDGSVKIDIKQVRKTKPKKGTIKRYILTCAQNNTTVHPEVFRNLQVMAEHYGAEILVSRFTYNKAKYSRNSVKPGSKKSTDEQELWYDGAIEPYVCDHSVRLAPGLVFCGEMNILPTAIRPLSGFESYTGRDSAIFPHPKVAMVSVATGKNQGTKFNYTTGTITQRNYLQKKAGLKAQFHHVYGGLLAEVDHRGRWWVRQLNATEDGELWDLDVRVDPDGKLTTGNRIEGITWGDIHEAFIDPVARDLSFAPGGVLDTLRPRYQFFHDVLDFRARMHHEIKDPHSMFWKHAHSYEDAEKEVRAAAKFLSWAHRDFVESVVCDSNHDNMLARWLREGDYKTDHVNAIFFLQCQLRVYKALKETQDRRFHLLETLCKEYGCPSDVQFLREDESYIICPEAGHGIECGMHGHRGVDGSRGSPAQFARMGRKANTAHTHKAGIHDGVFTSGLLGKFDQFYNAGPSSWSHSDILTYPTGKRAIMTYWDGCFAAGMGINV